jgi:3-oxoacyl-[acyl-carrier protein] reductase
MIDLEGRTALVTGGSRGIGRATALLLAGAGADVALTYRSRAADGEAVAAGIRAMGRRAHLSGGDLSDPQVARAMAEGVARAFGRLDCFVANAGTWPPEDVPLAELGVERWRATLAANLDAVFLSTRAALGLMGPGGCVVIVSSTAGQRGEAYHADYAATKGALIALTKSLAIECAPDIRVNCVAPGWVDTDMCVPAFEGEGRERVRLTIPLRRIPPPEDIAGPIVFLCSDLARHLTGEVVNVNGGSVLCG